MIKEKLTFDLPKLKILAINECHADNSLILNCPSLEALFCNWRTAAIEFRSTKKLKRLICFCWPVRVPLNEKFESLEYLNLFTERVSDRLLDLTPKLKRLVLESYRFSSVNQLIAHRQSDEHLSPLFFK